MGEDIRLPIGALFTILGAILFFFGLFTGGSAIYAISLGANVNLWTGIGMIIFGCWFLYMSLRPAKSKK